jgi:hypothetical protein
MMTPVTNRTDRALKTPAVRRQRSQTMSGHGAGRANQIVAHMWWLVATGAILVVAPEFAWVLAVVAAVFLGTRETRSTGVTSEGAS